jgi:ATP-independent RNA helicase DbpA
MSDPTEFSTLNLKPELLGNLADLGYLEMTLVQAKALPIMLQGGDVVARAKTGSGKTAAFGLALLNRLEVASFQVQALVLCPTRELAEVASFQVQALVLCPTRELADQVAREIRRLARAIPNIKILSVCGGSPLRTQTASLQRSPHIIVGTPGRVHKHLRDGNIDLSGLQTFVLDEADRMLDMGFMDELDAILAFVPGRRQTLLFSATYPDAIADISARVQHEPQVVDVTDNEQPAQITQSWCSVTRENRNAELVRVLRAWGGELNLVFCNTKIDCAEVASYLQAEKIVALGAKKSCVGAFRQSECRCPDCD